MIVLIARYHVKTGRGDDVLPPLEEMARRVRADEPGCMLYHASRSVDDPDLFVLYEHYRDEQALAAHRETDHFQELIEGQIVPLLEKRERELYELVVG